MHEQQEKQIEAIKYDVFWAVELHTHRTREDFSIFSTARLVESYYTTINIVTVTSVAVINLRDVLVCEVFSRNAVEGHPAPLNH